MIIMMFIPSLLYLLTLLKSKGKEERISNSMLFVGMLMIALLVMVSESYGVFPPIIARRFLVCLAVILIYSGLLMPGWVRRLFHLE
jgi:peptidoglycan/LPS O-acetylase OafA/YrhL